MWRTLEVIVTQPERRVKHLRKEFAEKRRHLLWNQVPNVLVAGSHAAPQPERDARRLVAEGSARDAKRPLSGLRRTRFPGRKGVCPNYGKLEVRGAIDVCWLVGLGDDPAPILGGGACTVTTMFCRTDEPSALVATTVMVAVPHFDEA